MLHLSDAQYLGTIARLFCVRRSLLLENLALRQQLAVFKRRHSRTRLTFLDSFRNGANPKRWKTN